MTQHSPVSADSPPSDAPSQWLVWAIILSQFAPPFMFSAVAVVLPSLGRDLQAGATALGLVETLFLASQLAFLLPSGHLADSSDKRTLYKVGLLVFGLSSLIIGTTSSIEVVLVVRVVQGIASAFFATTGPAILAEIVPPEARGRAFGRSIGVVYIGLTVGPIIAGYLVDLSGWRSVFLVGAALILVMTAVIHWAMPSKWQRPREIPHLASTLCIITAVTCVVGGSALIRDGMVGCLSILAGGVAILLFVRLQLQTSAPLLDLRSLASNAPLLGSLIVQLLMYVNAFSSIFILSLFMQLALKVSPTNAGQVIASGSVLMAILAPLSGSLSDKLRPERIAAFGVVAVLISGLLGLTLDATTSLTKVIMVLAIQGVGFAFFSSPNMTIMMRSATAASTGIVSALGAKARSLGMVAGMLVTGILTALYVGNEPLAAHADKLEEILHANYTVLVPITALALGVSLFTSGRKV